MGGAELIGREERDALAEVIDRGGVLFRYGFDEQRSGSFKVMEFEGAFAAYAGSKYALGVSSGSAALKVALSALGVKPGDEVITQAFTFVATPEAILESGATPVFCEVDESLNMSPDDLERKITPGTKAIIPVHMLGAPAELDEIASIAGKKGIPILEDSCQACGSSYKGRKTGTIGEIGVFSFDYVKTITTGEGGMVVTDNKSLYEAACEYHDHGHQHRTEVPRGEDSKEMRGFNFRMSELQGALGLVQLSRLDHVLSRQRENKAALKSGISPHEVKFRKLHDDKGDGADTLVMFLENAERAAALQRGLSERGIATKILPSALGWHFAGRWHHMRKDIKPADSSWEKTEKLLSRAIALPVAVKMTREQLDRTISAVNDSLHAS